MHKEAIILCARADRQRRMLDIETPDGPCVERKFMWVRGENKELRACGLGGYVLPDNAIHVTSADDATLHAVWHLYELVEPPECTVKEVVAEAAVAEPAVEAKPATTVLGLSSTVIDEIKQAARKPVEQPALVPTTPPRRGRPPKSQAPITNPPVVDAGYVQNALRRARGKPMTSEESEG